MASLVLVILAAHLAGELLDRPATGQSAEAETALALASPYYGFPSEHKGSPKTTPIQLKYGKPM